MPNVYIPLPETDKSVARKAVFAVVRQVMEITSIPADTMVNFKGDSDGNMQFGSTIPGSEDTRKTKLSSENMLAIEIMETYTENGVATMATTRDENLPIFMDSDLDIILRPIYSSNEIEINITYRANSRTAAKRWRDDIRMRVSQLRDVNIHKLEYHYTVPREFLYILREIHKLREATEGYGEDFDTYFRTNSTSKLTDITNQAGTVVDYGVPESQIRILGYFDFETAPAEITKGENAGQWTSEFTYKFIFDKPVGCNFRYPIMVHNQLLDMKLVPDPALDTDPLDKAWTYSLRDIYKMENPNIVTRHYDEFAPVRIPNHDEFRPNIMPHQMMPVISILCEIDPTQPKYYLDLHELGDYQIDPDIMEFIEKVEWKYLTLPYKSLLHLSVFRHSTLATDRNTTVTSDVKLMSTVDLSLRKNHRVLVSLVKDIDIVDAGALRRLKMFPKAAAKILSAIKVNIHKLEVVRHKADLTSFGSLLPQVGSSRQQINEAHVGMGTLSIGFIVARRLRDHQNQGM